MDPVTEVLSRHHMDEIRRRAVLGFTLSATETLMLVAEIDRLSEMIVRERELWNLRDLARAG